MAERFRAEDMDVVVGVFGDESSARRGLEALKAAMHDKTVYVHDAALVQHDTEARQVHIRESIGMHAVPGAAIGLFIGSIVGMFAGPIGFVVVTAAGAVTGGIAGYLSEHPAHADVERIAGLLASCAAAVIAVAPRGGDAPAVGGLLRDQGAEVHEVTLDAATVESLRKEMDTGAAAD